MFILDLIQIFRLIHYKMHQHLVLIYYLLVNFIKLEQNLRSKKKLNK